MPLTNAINIFLRLNNDRVYFIFYHESHIHHSFNEALYNIDHARGNIIFAIKIKNY